jgi:hypothetical protein
MRGGPGDPTPAASTLATSALPLAGSEPSPSSLVYLQGVGGVRDKQCPAGGFLRVPTVLIPLRSGKPRDQAGAGYM